jgi:diguanylate cyclase (GGDEF)-like protein
VRLVLDSLAEGVLILDRDEQIVLANEAWLGMMGTDLAGVLGRRASAFGWGRGGDSPRPWLATLEDGLARPGVRLELSAREGVRVLNVACAPICGPDGACRGVLLTLSDLTDLEGKRTELEGLLRSLAGSRREIEHQNAELRRLATTDSLTLCVNRRELFDRAGAAWEAARRACAPLACMMLDVDHFKTVNDNHGHLTGDAVLAHVGQIIRASVRARDIAGRYGGEEFCVLFPETSAAEAARLAERVRAAVEMSELDGVRVTVSVGVAEDAPGIGSIEALLEAADRALYQAKRDGRNRVCASEPLDDRRAA